jgi:hypothetical protein
MIAADYVQHGQAQANTTVSQNLGLCSTFAHR